MVGFTGIDYVILVVYILGVTAIGSLFARGQRNVKDFFLAGRNVWWFPMTLSVIATDFSAISFLGTPGYVVARNMVLEIQPVVFLWVFPLALFLFVRFFHRLELISAYEYLERRFNLPLRAGSSLLFICLRTSWMATALYATALALTQVTGFPLWACVIIMGGFTTLYSSLGGTKAVIWTDVAQFFVFTLAILLVLIKTAGSVPGGLIGIWHTADQAGHTRILSFDGGLSAITTPAVLIGGSFLVLISYGVDQVVIQRYLTARTLNDIKRGMIFQSFVTPVMIWTLALIGLGLFSYYTHFPDRLPAGLEPDKWFPHFIAHELPVGVSGLVIAGLLAATMSSISGGLNSVTAACVIDFYRRFFGSSHQVTVQALSVGAAAFSSEQDRKEVRLSRLLTVVWGGAATGLAFIVGKIGVIAIIAKTLSGFFGGVLLGVFLLGILLPRANGAGSLLGGLVGFAVISTIGLTTSVNLFWYAPIGCVVTFVCGVIFSLLFPAPSPEKINGLTLKM